MAENNPDTKVLQDALVSTTVSNSDEGQTDIVQNADEAFGFVGDEIVEYTEAESKSVLSKIDWHILPLLCLTYMIQFADKTTLNYASLMGIRTATHLNPKSQQFSWCSSIFYAGYLLWEFPTTYLLRRLPIGTYTSVNIVLWGIVLTLHACVSSYGGLLSVRFFLGVLEATVTPAFVIYTSMWYKKNEQGKRVGLWLAMNGCGTIIMSVLAYGLAGIEHAAIASWQILYLLLGLITVVMGSAYFYLMPNNLISARFLNRREKLIAIDRLRGNFQGVGSRVWKWEQFREAFRDPRTYLYFLFSLLMNIPNGGITTFGSIIIKSFGFSSRLSLLLSMPGGAVDIITKLTLTTISDRYLDRTGPAIVAILLPCLGGVLMKVLPLKEQGGELFGYYLISCAGASWGLVMISISNNSVGFTKKATVNGLQIVAYGAGNWIGPQTFRSNDAPNYPNGKLMVAIMYGLAAVVLIAIRVVNIMENKRRDRLAETEKRDSIVGVDDADAAGTTAFLDLTDFQQKKFRYVL